MSLTMNYALNSVRVTTGTLVLIRLHAHESRLTRDEN